MNKSKGLFIIALLLICVLSFSACSGTKTETATQLETENVTETTKVETQTETATALVTHTADEFVKTIKQSISPYSGLLKITGENSKTFENMPNRLPQLTIDSDDARAINDEIISDNLTKYETSEENDGFRFDYRCYLNNNVLSLVLENSTTNTPNNFFSVYNMDIDTKKRLSNNDIIGFSSINADQAKEEVKKAILAKFDEAGASEEITKEPLEKSLSDDNIEKAMYYFNNDGNLVAAYRYYWFAGAESYGDLLVFDAKIVNK